MKRLIILAVLTAFTAQADDVSNACHQLARLAASSHDLKAQGVAKSTALAVLRQNTTGDREVDGVLEAVVTLGYTMPTRDTAYQVSLDLCMKEARAAR